MASRCSTASRIAVFGNLPSQASSSRRILGKVLRTCSGGCLSAVSFIVAPTYAKSRNPLYLIRSPQPAHSSTTQKLLVSVGSSDSLLSTVTAWAPFWMAPGQQAPQTWRSFSSMYPTSIAEPALTPPHP